MSTWNLKVQAFTLKTVTLCCLVCDWTILSDLSTRPISDICFQTLGLGMSELYSGKNTLSYCPPFLFFLESDNIHSMQNQSFTTNTPLTSPEWLWRSARVKTETEREETLCFRCLCQQHQSEQKYLSDASPRSNKNMIFRNLPEWPHGVYYLLSLTLSPSTPALAEDAAQHKKTHLRLVLCFCLSDTHIKHTFLSGDAVTQICCISNKDAEFSNSPLVSSERTDVDPSICLQPGVTNFCHVLLRPQITSKACF